MEQINDDRVYPYMGIPTTTTEGEKQFSIFPPTYAHFNMIISENLFIPPKTCSLYSNIFFYHLFSINFQLF